VFVTYIRWLRNIVLGAGLLLAGSGYAYIQWDRAMNYQPVAATVLEFAKFCHPESSDPQLQALFDSTADYAHGKHGPCEGLKALGVDEHDFKMSGRSIVLHVSRLWRTKVRFVSPADGQQHESVVQLGPKDGETLSVGDTLTVLANTSDWARLQQP
jgi:hypothetical protein